jgi:glycosyltransferase involved in cell wall biosynthesis
MRIMVLGLRGLPDVPGGVETHVAELFSRVAAMGHEVEVLVRTPFARRGLRSHRGMILRPIWSPRRSGIEALVHSVIGTFYAAWARPDLLHIQAIGPAIVTPLARLLGLRVVVTHHGPDYDREKWGWLARRVLRTGERFGMRFANSRIAISHVIAQLVESKYGVGTELVPNGVVLPTPGTGTNHVRRFGVEPGRYVLMVSRVVPEKRQLDLIHAFAQCGLQGWRLVLVGGIGTDAYSRQVRLAAQSASVVVAGHQTGEPLQQLLAHAGQFVLPSSHEGLPIALLEALSHGLPVIASNIPAHLELQLEPTSYFPLGDVEALAAALRRNATISSDDVGRARRRQWVAERYNWDRVARSTVAIYERVIAGTSAV